MGETVRRTLGLNSVSSKAFVRIETPSPRCAETMFMVLEPESRRQLTPRSKIKVKHDGEVLLLDIEAGSASNLRAIINSYLRYILVIGEITSVLEGR